MDASNLFSLFCFIVFAAMLALIVKILTVNENSKWPYIIDVVVIAALSSMSCYLYEKPYLIFVPFVTGVSLIGMWCLIGARKSNRRKAQGT